MSMIPERKCKKKENHVYNTYQSLLCFHSGLNKFSRQYFFRSQPVENRIKCLNRC